MSASRPSRHLADVPGDAQIVLNQSYAGHAGNAAPCPFRFDKGLHQHLPVVERHFDLRGVDLGGIGEAVADSVLDLDAPANEVSRPVSSTPAPAYLGDGRFRERIFVIVA
ncbi:hypothetical protein ASE29_29745 [Ensifer sp. Root74]|nr:hypothetical protein ASD49_18985 [Ensifer sp. Root1298]KQX84198.1 hypothetical protein ASD41_32025 [Ensifer sp. Root1312]KRC22359.1 hypothetical protein ASE29_29745 [Ensifer sp. Root74]